MVFAQLIVLPAELVQVFHAARFIRRHDRPTRREDQPFDPILEVPSDKGLPLELREVRLRGQDQLIAHRKFPQRQPATHIEVDEVLGELLRVAEARIVVLQHQPRHTQPPRHVIDRKLSAQEHLKVFRAHIVGDEL